MFDHALTEINQQLDRWVRRYRARRAVRWSMRGAAGLLAVALIGTLIAVGRGLLLQGEFITLAIGFMLIGLVGTAAVGYVWPAHADRLAAARWFDRHFGLRERISTALEIGQTDRATRELEQRQVQDALLAAQHIDVRQRLPLQIKRVDVLLNVVLLAIVMLVAWRGDAFFQAAAQTRAVQQTVAAEVQQIEALRQQVEVDPSLTDAQRAELLAALQDTQQKLTDAQSLEQATAVLTQGEKKFESLASSQAEAQAEALRSAGQQLTQSENAALQSLGQNLADGDFLAAAENLRNLDVSQLSAAEAAALADQLDNLAEALQASNPELAQQLREAADAARQGDAQKAQQALQQAAEQMTATAQQVARSNVARRVSAGLGQGRQRMIAAGQSATDQTAQGQSSGKNGQSGQGVPAQQGNQPGQGSSNSNGAGAGSGAGKGTGDAGDAKGPEAGSKPIDQGNGPGDGGETTYEPIYAPQRLSGSGSDTVALPGSGDPNGDVLGQSGIQPGTDNASQVPYAQVFAAYAAAYRQAMDSDQVPPQFRDLIRQYFSSLEP